MQIALARALAVITTIVVAALALCGAASAADQVNWNVGSAFASGIWFPASSPMGANNWGCRLSVQHPYPVVLVHGTFENQNDNWQAIAPTLANDGYCVYAFTYGQMWYSGGLGGVADVYSSAHRLGSFIQTVLSATRVRQVDLVGHSQGGMLPRVYMKYDGGAPYVHQLVGIAPDNDLPSLSGLQQLASWIPGATQLTEFACPACSEQLSQPFFDSLNSGGETYPSVRYTVIASTHDELVTPSPERAFLPAGPNVTNETVQSICPRDDVGHLGLVYDKDAVQMLVNALDPSHAQPVSCSDGFGL